MFNAQPQATVFLPARFARGYSLHSTAVAFGSALNEVAGWSVLALSPSAPRSTIVGVKREQVLAIRVIMNCLFRKVSRLIRGVSWLPISRALLL